MYKISKSTIEELLPHKKNAEKEGIIFCKSTDYYSLISEGELVGFCGVIVYNKKIIFKNAYVLPNYRGKGFFKKMVDFRLDIFKGRIEATCTKMSLNYYLSKGFKKTKVFKNGCTKVYFESL